MNQFDSNLTKSLEDFMESYKMVDVEQIYSNGAEFVPIFRVKQWLEYHNINNLQSKIDKVIEYIEKYLEEHIIEDQPDEQSIFYDEKGYYIPNAKEQLLSILKEDK